ncbi:MAG: TIGR03905 family TSCPD domain-containing protein [Spirochaetales bacterium]|nr:TIGR03905 family TSCPD domain-containing protein [Spirochaetales bacterium]
MKNYTYRPHGVCSRQIDIVLSADDEIKEARITGGCPGNTVGLCLMVQGRKAQDVIEILEGTECGIRGTSCPDQMAQALKEILAQKITA